MLKQTGVAEILTAESAYSPPQGLRCGVSWTASGEQVRSPQMGLPSTLDTSLEGEHPEAIVGHI